SNRARPPGRNVPAVRERVSTMSLSQSWPNPTQSFPPGAMVRARTTLLGIEGVFAFEYVTITPEVRFIRTRPRSVAIQRGLAPSTTRSFTMLEGRPPWGDTY